MNIKRTILTFRTALKLHSSLLGFVLLCVPYSMVHSEEQFAQQTVDVSLARVSLIPSAFVVKDVSNTLQADEVLARISTMQTATSENIVSFGFSNATHWFVVPLQNPKSAPLKRLLIFEPTWLDQVEIQLMQAGEIKQRFKGGDSMAFVHRTIPQHKINFALTIPTGHSLLLVRTQTVDPYHVGMTLSDSNTFYAESSTELLYLGLMYGAVIAMLLYNLMLFLSVREKVYAAYISYLFFFLLMHATYNGYSYGLFWPNSPVWSNWAHSVFIHLFIGSGLFFAINFLELKRHQSRVYRWTLRFAVMLTASFIITAIIGGYGLQVRTSIFWVIIYAPFVLILGLLSLKSGNRAARFFLTAAIAGFIGSFITALAVAGLIEYSYLSYHAVDVGMLIDAVLLSFALADRLRLARVQHEQASAALMEASNNYALKLEKTVAERTIELSTSNATKDKFFSIIAHDLRGPIGGLNALLNQTIQTAADVTPAILDMARESTKNTHDFLEQLLSWARSQRGELKFAPIPVELSEILAETQELFSAQARSKGIQLQMHVSAPLWVFADLAMLQTVLRNLTNNALKFTPRDGTVHAIINNRDDHCRIQIKDSGVGIDKQTQQALFKLDATTHSTEGTEGESGAGFGLILCAEFIARNGGAIGVDSEPGEGSTFWFTLPKADK